MDGRDELLSELIAGDEDVRYYIAEQFKALIQHPDFEYAVLGNLQNRTRSDLFFSRWEMICAMI